MEISEKVAYLKGLAEGLALDTETKEGKLIAAIIDVLDTEPPTEEDLAIAYCPNTLLTPHIAGSTYEVTDHQAEILNDRIKQWFRGEDLARIVYNKDVLSKLGL